MHIIGKANIYCLHITIQTKVRIHLFQQLHPAGFTVLDRKVPLY